MLASGSAHLAFDYVATRDIDEGEELFLDYGDAWEEAWQRQLAQWEKGPENYLSARGWNDGFRGFPIRTAEEAYYDPYPSYIQIRCHADLIEDDWGSISEWGPSDYGFECQIVDRFSDEAGNERYNVRLRTEALDRWDFDFEDSEILEVGGIPRSAIRFFDVPFTSDIHLRGTFRHFIGLPEDMMQDVWRNRRRQDEVVGTGMNDEL
eukprot:scaffold818_cov136-Cylindrotheca_fusiformis.AAC.32